MRVEQRRSSPEADRERHQELFRNALSSSAGKVFWDVLGRALSFALSILIARRLGVAGYGQYAVVWYLAWMSAQFTDLGLHLVALRTMAQEGTKFSRVLRDAMVAKALLTLLTFAGFIAFSLLTRRSSAELLTGLFFYGATLAGSWAELFGVALRSRGKLALEGVVMVLLRGGWLVGSLTALEGGGGVREIGVSLFLASLPGLGLGAVLVNHYVRSAVSKRWGDLLRQSAPLALTSVITVVYLRLDVLLLSYLTGDEAAGLFAAPFRLFEGLFLFSGGIVAGAFPLIAARVGAQSLPNLAAFVSRLLLAVAVPAAVGLAALGGPIIEFLYGSGYKGASLPLVILAAAVVAVYVNALTTHLLVAKKRNRTLVVVMCIRLFVGLILDVVLIPSFGPLGAALAVVAAEWSLTAASLMSVRSALPPFAVLKESALPAASSLVMVGILRLMDAPLVLHAFAGVAAYGAAYFTFWGLAHRFPAVRRHEVWRFRSQEVAK